MLKATGARRISEPNAPIAKEQRDIAIPDGRGGYWIVGLARGLMLASGVLTVIAVLAMLGAWLG